MSHLHFPDGILTLAIWLGAWIITAVLLAASMFVFKRKDSMKKAPLIGVMSAIMVVGMSVEIIFIAYHINLSVPTGIILGPALGFISAFIANMILALFGHGGITVAGLNTLLLAIEMILGWLFFIHIIRIRNIFSRAFISAFLALVISSVIAISITVASVGASPHLHEEDTVGSLRLNFISQEGQIHEEEEHKEEHKEETSADPRGFVIAALGLGAIGWILESIVVASLISYLAKVKPELLPKSIFRKKDKETQ